MTVADISERQLLESLGWLKPGERPVLNRLAFRSTELNSAPMVFDKNRATRDLIVSQILSSKVQPCSLLDPLSPGSKDILLAEVDRYGLPLRTLLNTSSGLIRSDPYYSAEWLEDFYRFHYRRLYVTHGYTAPSNILAEQLQRGERYHSFIGDYLQAPSSLLEIGCGMGGVLVPFMLSGHKVTGIDQGGEHLGYGLKLGLDLQTQSLAEIALSNTRFDLVILSHLLEHIVDLKQFLAQVRAVLSERGLLFVAVPGVRFVGRTYTGDFLRYLQNAHCWSFCETTLSRILEESGFNVLRSTEEVLCLAQKRESRLGPNGRAPIGTSILSHLLELERPFLSLPKRFKLKFKRFLNLILNRFGSSVCPI